MKVADILKVKGNMVLTVHPNETIVALARLLRLEDIGAMVVSEDKQTISGIISERDVVHGLAEQGANLPDMYVSNFMTKKVITCSPDDSIAAVAKVMTKRHVRHLPVQKNNELVGLVSVRDIVKQRLDEVEMEANVLRDYAVARQ